MCGICGIYNFGNGESADLQILKKMNRTMVHRGPDDEGYYCRRNFGFAMRRLSVIDPSGGHQPIYNEDKTVWTVCNGEIYNFKELKDALIQKGHIFYTKSDSEVLVHLYEEYGEDFIDKLRGMFGFAVWDLKREKLIIARDHIGIKPLYYYLDSNQIVFGSEIKAIHQYKQKSDVNFEAFNHYLSFLYITTPHSIYKDINKLLPGHYMVINAQGASTKKYWEIEYKINHRITENEVLEQMEELFKNVIKRHLISDVPLGAFLSGGLDSSLVVYFMSRLMNEPVKTFTIGFKEKSFDETGEAKLVADALNTDHTELIVEPNVENITKQLVGYYDEPFADYSSIPFFLVSELARQKVTVALTGDGGDELFGGYPTYFAPDVKNVYGKIPGVIRNKIIKKIVHKLPTSFDRITMEFMAKRFVNGAELDCDEGHYYWKVIFDLDEKLKLLKNDYRESVYEFDSVQIYKDLFSQFDDLDMKNRLMFIDYSTLLFDDILPKSDRMSMANGLEVRVPLLDRDMVDFSGTISGNMKTKGYKTKSLFRKLAKKVLPSQVSKMPKRGFSPPVAFWLQNELKDYTKEVLCKENIDRINMFEYSYIEKIMHEHFNKTKDNNRKIWALLIFVIWWYEHYKKNVTS